METAIENVEKKLAKTFKQLREIMRKAKFVTGVGLGASTLGSIMLGASSTGQGGRVGGNTSASED